MLKAKLIIPLALVCSLGAAYVAKNRIAQLRGQQDTERPKQPVERAVVVAAVDLEIGSELTEEALVVRAWPPDLAPEGSFSTVHELVGCVLRSEILIGEPIVERKLAPLGSMKGLSSRIPVGMVAMTVGVNVVSGVSGFVLPGCRVDVLVTTSTEYKKESATTKIILQNIEVVAVDQETQRDSDSPLSVQAVTLLVTPKEAEKLALGGNEGKLQLTLRNVADSQQHETTGMSLAQLVDKPKPKPSRVYRPSVRKSTPDKPKAHTVEVFRSGEKSEVSFKEGDKKPN